MKSFKESQSMLAVWLFAVLILVIGYQLYLTWSDPKDLIRQPGFWISVIIFILLAIMRLKTNYTAEGIYIVFIPFVWKKFIPWNDIASAYIRIYNLTDFGGWGYRFSKQGKALCTKGDQGLQLILRDGSQIMIGTQQPEEIQKIINQYKPYKDEF